MAKPAESHELLTTSKEANVAVGRSFDGRSPEKSPAPSPEIMLDRDAENVDRVTRIRRIFNFSQLFWFSLTFMSTWIGMNT